MLLNKLILSQCPVQTVISLVAALSSDITRVDVDLFDLPVSIDGLSIKYQTDVAMDMKVFLSRSKLVGKVDLRPFLDIHTC